MKSYIIDLIFLVLHSTNLSLSMILMKSLGQLDTLVFRLTIIIISNYVLFNLVHLLINIFENPDNNRRIYFYLQIIYNLTPCVFFFTNVFYYIPQIIGEKNQNLYISFYIFYLFYTAVHMILAIKKMYQMFSFPRLFIEPSNSRVSVYIEPLKCVVIQTDKSNDLVTTKCCICMDKDVDAKVVPCGHRDFCFDCIQKVWPNCPICRAEFQTIEHECIISTIN